LWIRNRIQYGRLFLDSDPRRQKKTVITKKLFQPLKNIRSVSNPTKQAALWNRIRIEFGRLDLDSDPGGQKITHKKVISCFKMLDVLF
jgi:hypothetical protein